MKYLVLELQKDEDGHLASLLNDYETREQAEQKFHMVLGYAATSSIYRHSAILMTDEGAVLRSERYSHPNDAGEDGEPVFPVTDGESQL